MYTHFIASSNPYLIEARIVEGKTIMTLGIDELWGNPDTGDQEVFNYTFDLEEDTEDLDYSIWMEDQYALYSEREYPGDPKDLDFDNE
jgi:hypothetical protein